MNTPRGLDGTAVAAETLELSNLVGMAGGTEAIAALHPDGSGIDGGLDGHDQLLLVQTGHIENHAEGQPQIAEQGELFGKTTGFVVGKGLEIWDHIQLLGSMGCSPFRFSLLQRCRDRAEGKTNDGN